MVLRALRRARGDGAEPAYIRCTGDVNMRSEPSLDGELMMTKKAGNTADFVYGAAVDERGVLWNEVAEGLTFGWISSKCAELVCGDDAPIYDLRDLEITALANNVVRSAPDETRGAEAEFEMGDELEYRKLYVDKGRHLWFNVYFREGLRYGWVSDRYVDVQFGD